MPRVLHRLLPLALLASLAVSADAQQVRGRLLRESDSTAVGDALVLLLDDQRREVARAATTPSGGFALAGRGPGRYVVRVQRIGFQPWETPAVTLSVDEPWTVTLHLPERPFELPELTSYAERPACGVSLSDPALATRMLEAAQTALGLAEAEAAGGRRRYVVQTWRRTLQRDGTPHEDDPPTIPLVLKGWPVQSADPESLRAWGFVRGEWPRARDAHAGGVPGPTYYAPDARVLFTDWFLDAHCFTADRTEADGDSTLTLRFEPRKEARARGLEGELVLSRRALELRSLAWRFPQRPSWVPRDLPAGGSMQFARLDDGSWVPVRWSLRAPVPKVVLGDYELHGYMEAGGHVLSALGADGKEDRALTMALRRAAMLPPRPR